MEINEQMQELEAQIVLGFQKSFRKLIEFKKKHNSPLIVSRNGKVTIVPPNEFPLVADTKRSAE